MHSDSPGKGQFRQIGVVVAHLPLCELHQDLLLFQVDRNNGAQISIEHLTLVVVDLLDHAIPHAQDAPSPWKLNFPWFGRVEELLEHAVELARPYLSSRGRTEHL